MTRKHVRRRRLLLKRLPQFVEQPGILDGDDGLGGEILQQRDLPIGKWPHFLTVNTDFADQLAFLEHRHHKKRAYAGRLDEPHRRRIADLVRLLLGRSVTWSNCLVAATRAGGVERPGWMTGWRRRDSA